MPLTRPLPERLGTLGYEPAGARQAAQRHPTKPVARPAFRTRRLGARRAGLGVLHVQDTATGVLCPPPRHLLRGARLRCSRHRWLSKPLHAVLDGLSAAGIYGWLFPPHQFGRRPEFERMRIFLFHYPATPTQASSRGSDSPAAAAPVGSRATRACVFNSAPRRRRSHRAHRSTCCRS
jgi:hypothetical protein